MTRTRFVVALVLACLVGFLLRGGERVAAQGQPIPTTFENSGTRVGTSFCLNSLGNAFSTGTGCVNLSAGAGVSISAGTNISITGGTTVNALGFGTNNTAPVTINTTDATKTTVFSYTPADGEAGYMIVFTIAKTTSSSPIGSTAISYAVAYKRVSGVVTIAGGTQPIASIGDHAYSNIIEASGGNVIYEVTGGAANVTWTSTTTITKN